MTQEGGATDRETLDRDLEILHDVQPYTKDSQLKPGRPRRYRRKVAGPKQWTALRIEKLYGERCRCCGLNMAETLHHLVPRKPHCGDDVADNLIPLCGDGTRLCHGHVTANEQPWLRLIAESLTDAEYAYIIGKLGEGGLERLFGVNRDGRPVSMEARELASLRKLYGAKFNAICSALGYVMEALRVLDEGGLLPDVDELYDHLSNAEKVLIDA